MLAPIFEREFAEHSYGFRYGLGCKDALRRVAHLLSEGYTWVLDADLKRYFDTIPHDQLLALLGRKISDRRVLALVRQWIASAGLILHPDKTCLVDASQHGGFDFLGYHFERGYHWPSKKAQQQLRERIRPLTHRAHGHSMETIVSRLNPILSGWFEYFKHGRPYDLLKLDGWVRMRLRSILRKRRKRKGRAKGRDRQRWPNAHFATLGLFSLDTAHRAACQPV